MAGRRNKRVSTVFRLKRQQATLDFVDVDIERDTKVFISPRALQQMHTDWADGCVSLVQNFFETVLEHIKSGDHDAAEEMLGQLREPNETHLGLSSGKSRGRALGDESAHDVWRALSRSEAAKTGLIKDLEDTVLLIHGIGVDIVSDITTNIIRAPLIKYTQEQCKQLGIPLSEGVPSGPLWNPSTKEWFSKYVELPLTTEGKLILVPKAIVRRTSLYDKQEYFRHFLLEHMRRSELEAGTSLVKALKSGPKVHKIDLIEKYGKDNAAIVAQTFIHPAALSEYKNSKSGDNFLPLSHEEIAGVEKASKVDWDGLLDQLESIEVGREDAAAYERAVESLITALFYPDLNHPVYQSAIHENRKRLDIKYTNMALAGFFSWVAKHYMAPQVFIECKNYGKEVANPELDQLSSRFGRSRGEFGILICRTFKDKARFEKRCRDTALDGRGYIIALDDFDLKALVESRKADSNDYRQWTLLRKKFDNLLT